MQKLRRKFILVCTLTVISIMHLRAQPVDITIDWTQTIRVIPELAYGVNSSANFIPSYSNDSVFMGNLERITQKKGLVRLHGWGMLGDSPESWLIDGEWDSVKIHQALLPLQQQGYQVMINIPSGALGDDDYQNPQEFAQYCAKLVKIVNIDYQLGIEYWEIPNEREKGFANPGLSVSEMAIFIQTASQAMKAIDPSIKVGGAATAWVNVDYLTQLVEATFPTIDFITCHTYPGDCSNSLKSIYDNAQYAIEDLGFLRQNINVATGNEYLPIFLTEYNLSYQGCDYIQSNEGAVYDAIIMTESMKAGIDGTYYWNVAPYSDMSILNGDILDENVFLFEAFNTFFHGEMTQNASSDSAKILVYSVINQNANRYAFCIINRTAMIQDVDFQMIGLVPESLGRYLWDDQQEFFTESTDWSSLGSGNLLVSPYSVNIFTGELNALSVVNGEKKIDVFPNPNNGILHLSAETSFKTFQVYSSLGEMITSGEIKNNQIDLRALPASIYYVQLLSEKKNASVIEVIMD